MKRFVTLTTLLLCLLTVGMAQTKIKRHPAQPTSSVRYKPVPALNKTAATGLEPIPASIQTDRPETEDIVIGETWYDLQTNGALSSRIVYSPDGNLSAAWTFASDAGFADRGTGYNQTLTGDQDWGFFNQSRIEAERTGFPSLVIDGAGNEHVFSHNANGNILHYNRNPASGTWVGKVVPHQINPGGLWAKSAASGNTLHMVYSTIPSGNGGTIVGGMDGKLLYCRSTNGGVNWDKIDVRIPGMDSTKFNRISADQYSIDANGETVAIGVYALNGDKMCFISRDNGETWSSRIVQDFIFDDWWIDMPVDTNLILAQYDSTVSPAQFAMLTGDGSGAVLVDHEGMVHFWYSALYIEDTDWTTAGYTYYPRVDVGIIYWNESMPDDSGEVAGFAPDLDGDGQHGANLEHYTEYGFALCTQPSVGIHDNGDIFLVFNAPNELDINAQNNSMHRKPFITKRTGNSWGSPQPVLTNFNSDPFLSEFQEMLYATAARRVTDYVHIIAQVDYEQGQLQQLPPSEASGIHYMPVPSNLPFAAPLSFSGLIYSDLNGNGQQDANEPLLKGVIVNRNGTPKTSSKADGSFKINRNTFFPDTLTVIPPPYSSALPISRVLEADKFSGYDFGLMFQPNVTDACVSMDAIPVFRAGFPTYIHIVVSNPGTIPFNGQLKVVLDSKLDFISSTPAAALIVGDTLFWNFSNTPVGAEIRLTLEVKVKLGSILGDLIKCTAVISTVAQDFGPRNNLAELCDPIVGSYDPNDKRCLQGDIFTPAQLQDTLPLDYLIRFQNTGNYQADFVRVLDTISTNLRLNTLELVATSHNCNMTIREDRVVDFFFPNINLPDSTSNEPESHGFIHYRIYPKLDLVLNQSIENTAYIYFDFNPPIITNTTKTTINEILSLFDAKNIQFLAISPNPNKGEMWVELPAHKEGFLEVFDELGRRVYQGQTNMGSQYHISLSHLSAGTYFVRWNQENNELHVGKVVIQR